METNDFRFKQFVIKQNKCAFKVGTDSVLLGAWAESENTNHILDIGTGSGILALMMAQKSNAKITAIDIDLGAVEQAQENAQNSVWKNRIQVLHSSVQDHAKQNSDTFDLIITNPPYFINKAHAMGTALSNARNTLFLPFEELIRSSLKLMNKEGKLYLVLPVNEAIQFRKIAEKSGLVLSKLLKVQTKPGEQFEKRHLMLFQKTAFHYSEEILVIDEQDQHTYSADYRELTKDFYLAF